MTNEKAIMILDNEMPQCGEKLTFSEEEIYEAFKIAINAIKTIEEIRKENNRNKAQEVGVQNTVYELRLSNYFLDKDFNRIYVSEPFVTKFISKIDTPIPENIVIRNLCEELRTKHFEYKYGDKK